MDTTENHGILEKVPKRGIGLGGEKTRKKTKIKPFLPDDIILNILIRLPAKTVVKCRLVCKGWRDITLNRDFLDLHFRHSFPFILVSNRGRYTKTADYFFLLDKWWELPGRKKLMIHKFIFDPPRIKRHALFSHAGLVAFSEDDYFYRDRSFIVCNPMDPSKHVRITLSKAIMWSQIYGVFFHPSRKEYCSLWFILESNGPWDCWSRHPKQNRYKMLTLGSNPFIKTIDNPFSHRVKCLDSSPVFIDKYLYWMLKPENDEYKNSGRYDIMQFDILSEEFTVMPCPIPDFPVDDTKASYYKSYLLNVDGSLSFLLISSRKITIWRLEDHALQLWTTANYTFTTELQLNYGVQLKATTIVDGKLALLSSARLIVCNLMHGTIYYHKTPCYKYEFIQSHQMSLASLTNCTSHISIDQDGEIARKVSEG